ncbi:ATP-binding protein [Streptomyces sp. MAR4 CNY-716]
MAISETDIELYERQAEIELGGGVVNRVGRGDGGTLVLRGEAGLGKSSLLQVLRGEASRCGVRTLSARGGEFEQDFAWGVVHQLFEPWLRRLSTREREQLFSGPARLASALFGQEPEAAPSTSDDLSSVLRGLYWLCQNLSTQQPIVVVIDDAQWVDLESLRFISYLANRLEGSSLGLVLAGETVSHGTRAKLLGAVSACPNTSFVELKPLSPSAVRAMVARSLDQEPAERFAHACHDATEGSPLLLSELLTEVAAQSIEPVEESVSRLRQLVPSRVAEDFLRRLSGTGDNAVRLAGAIAVLGDDAVPEHCSHVARLSVAEVTAAAGVLSDAGLVWSGRPYAFTHGMLRGVVHSSTSVRERDLLHRQAAQSLTVDGASPDTVAEHLCQTQPRADSRVVDWLRRGATAALMRDEPGRATRFLHRALAEPPPTGALPSLIAELGAAELRAGDRAAVGRLWEALEQAHTPDEAALVRIDLGHALAAASRYEEAIAVLGDVPAARPSPALQQLFDLLGGTLRYVLRPHEPCPPTASTPAWTRRLYAAVEALRRGAAAPRVVRLTESALDHASAMSAHDVEANPAVLAAWLLARCDRLLDAERALTEPAEYSGGSRRLLAEKAATGMRAMVLYECGRLGAAERLARSVLLDVTPDSLRIAGVPLATAALVSCLIDSDRATEADALLTQKGLTGPLPSSGYYVPLRIARGRLWMALGRGREGVWELLACRELAQELGWDHPAVSAAYLDHAALAMARGDWAEDGHAYVSGELDRARAFGAPRPLAIALRGAGLLEGGAAGLAKLEESAALLSQSPAVLESARTAVAFGSALRRAGHRKEARCRLLDGIEAAQRCGAGALEKTARSELRLAGGRPRAADGAASSALTPAERRVVLKAAAGRSNKEIARELFVTVKTVEWHLSQSYPKLGISRRSQLSQALSAMGLRERREAV